MDRNKLFSFFSNEASVKEVQEILTWLDEDPEHKKELLRERRIFDATIMNIDEPNEEETKKVSRLWSWTKEFLKVAAVAALVFGLTSYFFSKEQEKLLTAKNTVSVPAGQRVNIVLSDGTSIWLNALAELEYPSAFAGDYRKISLKGEAYFEVAHDKEKPFVVVTQDFDIEVLGTTFNLDANSDVDKFSASLIEGKIKVTNRSNPTESIFLEANQQAFFNAGELKIQSIKDFEIFRWREGLFCFRNSSFSSLLAQIEKYYDVEVIIKTNNISQSQLSGKLRISDGVDHALKVLQKNLKFSYKKDDNIIHIY